MSFMWNLNASQEESQALSPPLISVAFHAILLTWSYDICINQLILVTWEWKLSGLCISLYKVIQNFGHRVLHVVKHTILNIFLYKNPGSRIIYSGKNSECHTELRTRIYLYNFNNNNNIVTKFTIDLSFVLTFRTSKGQN